MADPEQTNLTTLTVDLLSAYFANNTVDSAALPGLIRSTHDTLKSIEQGEPEVPAEPEFKPAVSIRKSTASKDHIISLIDGKHYKTLKRHLAGHGLTPSEYRERYKLPRDYPMVAPGYSEQRRQVAQKLGLGRKSGDTADTSPPAPTDAPLVIAAAAPNAVEPKPKRSVKAASTPVTKTKAKTASKPTAARKAPSPKSKAAAVELTPPPMQAEAVAPQEPSPRKSSATAADKTGGTAADAGIVASPPPQAPKAARTRKPKAGASTNAAVAKAPAKRAPRKAKGATDGATS